MPLVELEELRLPEGRREERLARALEEGFILRMSEESFALPESDRNFLLAQRQNPGRFHKNIAYRPSSGRLTGFAAKRADVDRLRAILSDYSQTALRFLAGMFPTYARSWHVDYASFRPFEEMGRALPPKARNDRIHVDAFPTRPSFGDRILRFFTNIHRSRAREWVSAGSFERLAERYAVSSGLLAEAMEQRRPGAGTWMLSAVGLAPRPRSPYDTFMLRFHDFLKANSEVQTASELERLSFPPGSSWIVMTDMVSHAVLAGQHALEQTVIVRRDSLSLPEKAPVAILERLAGVPLTRST